MVNDKLNENNYNTINRERVSVKIVVELLLFYSKRDFTPYFRWAAKSISCDLCCGSNQNLNLARNLICYRGYSFVLGTPAGLLVLTFCSYRFFRPATFPPPHTKNFNKIVKTRTVERRQPYTKDFQSVSSNLAELYRFIFTRTSELPPLTLEMWW